MFSNGNIKGSTKSEVEAAIKAKRKAESLFKIYGYYVMETTLINSGRFEQPNMNKTEAVRNTELYEALTYLDFMALQNQL